MWEGALKATLVPKLVSAKTATSATVPFIFRRRGGGDVQE
jgi:hypothetical protein